MKKYERSHDVIHNEIVYYVILESFQLNFKYQLEQLGSKHVISIKPDMFIQN